MALIDPGNGTLKSETLEAAFLEVAEYVQPLETALNLNNIAVSYNSDQLTASINASIPITRTIANNGAVTYAAANTLQDSFNNGGGDIGSTHGYAAFWEVAHRLQGAESTLETPINNVSITVNDEQLTATITATLPISFAIGQTGRIEIIADEYAA